MMQKGPADAVLRRLFELEVNWGLDVKLLVPTFHDVSKLNGWPGQRLIRAGAGISAASSTFAAF